MKETPLHYAKRILSYIEGKEPLALQAATAERLAQLIEGVSTSELRRRPAPDKWSVSEIIAHLADTEIVLSWRMRLVICQNGAPMQATDQDVWAQTLDYAGQDPKVSLEIFRMLRENNLRMLEVLPKNRWENYGMHSEHGKQSLAHIVRMYAGHDLNHLAQVEKIAGESGSKRN